MNENVYRIVKVTKYIIRTSSHKNTGLIVTKEVSSEDARACNVCLTEKANSLLPLAKELQAEWLNQVTKGFTDIEKRNF